MKARSIPVSQRAYSEWVWQTLWRHKQLDVTLAWRAEHQLRPWYWRRVWPGWLRWAQRLLIAAARRRDNVTIKPRTAACPQHGAFWAGGACVWCWCGGMVLWGAAGHARAYDWFKLKET